MAGDGEIVGCHRISGLDGLWRQDQGCLRGGAVCERLYNHRKKGEEVEGRQVEGTGELRCIGNRLVGPVPSHGSQSR